MDRMTKCRKCGAMVKCTVDTEKGIRASYHCRVCGNKETPPVIIPSDSLLLDIAKKGLSELKSVMKESKGIQFKDELAKWKSMNSTLKNPYSAIETLDIE